MIAYQQYTKRLNFFEKLVHATYPELFLVWILLTLGFTITYFTLGITHPAHAPTFPVSPDAGGLLFNSFYYSLVTATTTGYGDIVPQGISKMISMIQAILSILVFTALVGKIVSQRQDVTLHEVHRMSFEGVFYHIRHILFIVRKDFDDLIQKANKHKQFEPQDWDNLTTAYLQAQSLIEEIPELYSGHGFDLHNVDLTREKLLFESLHRTLTRVQLMLETLDKATIDWRVQEGSYKELRKLLGHLDAIMPLWKERSPFHEEKEFEDIRVLSAALHAELKHETKN